MMKRVKKIAAFSVISLALILSGCNKEKPSITETGKTKVIDPSPEVYPEYIGNESGHWKVDSNGNRASELEPHQLVHYKGDDKHVDKEPTCETPGIRYDVCSICGKIITVEIPKLDHEYDSWEVSTPATCSTKGSETRKCKKCGHIEVEWERNDT